MHTTEVDFVDIRPRVSIWTRCRYTLMVLAGCLLLALARVVTFRVGDPIFIIGVAAAVDWCRYREWKRRR